MLFDSSSYSINTEYRKMSFKGTQGNISDINGNFLMSSNGIWIADATNDTMMNGGGINPNGITSSWVFGLPMLANNVFLPFPGDSTKYLLMHHTATQFSGSFLPALELYYSLIDITQNRGLGSVISKNNIVLQDTLGWGIGACRHANGTDWWVVMMKDSSDVVFKVLLDSSNNDNYMNQNSSIVIADFDRCTGMFSNTQTVQLTSGTYLWGLAFSSSGDYAYACSQGEIYQINTTTLSIDTVAVYDGFISPPTSTCCPSTFFNMYLAANGKIYITSGSGIRHFTEINYPDSAGTACNVQQHAVFIGNYAHLSAVPNHPNYYLGCDTSLGCPCLITGIDDQSEHDFNFGISPNPSDGKFKISYLLPQNQKGLMEIFDNNGKEVYKMNLPPWSTMQ